ncbi:ABC transporter ATP-binding protein [Candidatus Saccharibacteria bacterium]|nr:ABC transporter ATP-binding protein [Candidatus Saccharibacteria bacterium]
MFNGGGRGGRGAHDDKSKNFGLALKRLFVELKAFWGWIAIAILLAVGGSILAINAPNKLADMTDKISEGLVVDRDKIVRVSQEILANPQEESKIDGKNISVADKASFLKTMQEMQESLGAESIHEGDLDQEKAKKIYAKIDELPESIRSLIEPKMDLEAIKNIALFIAGIYIISAILEFFEGVTISDVSNKFAKSLRRRISEKINRLPLRYFDSHQAGDVLSRVTNDVDTVGMSLTEVASTLVSEVALLAGAVIMMFITNWTMALTAVAASIIGFVFMALVLKKSQKYFRAQQDELGKLNAHIEETYSGLDVVKAYNGSRMANLKFDKLNRRVYHANQKSQFLSGLMHPFMAFIGNFGYVAVCVVGAILTMNGAISFGVIVAFIAYVRLFTASLSRFAQSIGGLQSGAAASERVFEFLDEEEMSDQAEIKSRVKKETIAGEVEFDHVKFGYEKDKLIIKDFSVKAKAGQKVAIVGPTGAGKTTLVNLLMKFYEVNDGEIRIDGKSTKEMTREDIHALFTMVLQDTWMFSGTVRDNIVYNRKNVSDERVMEVCDTIGLGHFIKTLPKGLDTDVLESDSISAGQKQLLTIARGMIEDAPLLILDEATSNVDTRTEELVQKAMDKLMKGRTSFIIAHRLSTIKNADIILVMNEGNVIETGNHKQLMEKGGFYADLYNAQFAL